jgi:DNA recombination protein RmuC
MEALTVAVAFLAVSIVVAAVVVRRAGSARGGTLGEQLGELRARLDTLVTAQAEVPRAVANGAASQAEALGHVRERLAELTAAAQRLDAVGDAVGDLQRLLAVPKLRGALGELWLEELLRDALPPGHYDMQYAFASGERVDAVVRLRDRLIPVDAKFPLEGWRRVIELDGEDAERERRAFLRSVRARVDEIATRYIRPDEGTTDFAVMYVPAEGVFYEALLREGAPHDEGLLDYARRRRVLVASPHTFWAYLSAVALGLRGVALEARQQAVWDSLTALQREVGEFFDVMETARRHLGNAERQFAEAERRGYRLQDRLGAMLDGRLPPDDDGVPPT